MIRDKYADTINVGLFLKLKYRSIARRKGTKHAAYLLRKQGFSLELAKAVLL